MATFRSGGMPAAAFRRARPWLPGPAGGGRLHGRRPLHRLVDRVVPETRAEPGLRVVVLDAAFAGSGLRAGTAGWLTAALPGSRDRYARGPRGRAGVLDMQRQLQRTVDEVAAVCAAEGVDAHLVKGGSLERGVHPRPARRLRERCAPTGPGAWKRPTSAISTAARLPAGLIFRTRSPLSTRRIAPGSARPCWWRALPRRPSAPGRSILRGDAGQRDRAAPGPHGVRRYRRALRAAGHRGVHRPAARPAPHPAADEQFDGGDRAARRGAVAADRLGRLRDPGR